MQRFVILFLLTVFIFCPIFGDDTQSRTALIIGNSNYASSPLKNPVNDASAMAERLSTLGFDVTLKTDVSLSEMESSVRRFAADLEKNKGVGLFFYAGHAVQVDGYNYLIPLGPGIESEEEIKFHAYNAGQILESMEGAGNGANLIFLDACRDNPFAASFRSSSRGLRMVEAPSGSLIAYATAPGKTAADGEGSNGVFTEALLKHIEEPEIDVEVLLRDVRAEVIEKTDGKQTPWTSSSLITPFYFADSALILSRIAARKEAVSAELVTINGEIERLTRARNSAVSDSERRKLELEQNAQAAKLEAARLEAEQLQQEEARQKLEAEQRAKEEAARTRALEEERSQQANLLAEAEQKRKEMESLKQAGEDPDLLLDNIHSLEEAIKDIERSFNSAWSAISREISSTYQLKKEAVDTIEMDPWESDAEFNERIGKLKNNLTTQERSELSSRRVSHDKSLEEQLADLKRRLSEAVRSLETKRWTLSGSEVNLTPYDFNRDTKEWAFCVESLERSVPFKTVLSVSLAEAEDLRTAYQIIDTAIKSSALSGRIEYAYDHRTEYSGSVSMYDLQVKSVRIIDLLDNNSIVVQDNASTIISTFGGIDQRKEPLNRFSNIRFWCSDTQLDVYYKGALLGTTPFSTNLFLEGQYPLLLKTKNGKTPGGTRVVQVPGGSNRSVQLETPFVYVQGGFFKMGDPRGSADEKPEHSVYVSSFIMAKYELTKGLQHEVLGRYGSVSEADREKPATYISWIDALEFCNKLSNQEGLEPVYTVNGSYVHWDKDKNGYRLPTEAEWEYAARGGALKDDVNYSGSSDLGIVGWYKNNSHEQLQPVGRKRPNGLGLYDMSGNVWEWCWDRYGEYTSSTASDPQGPYSGDSRVLRGGDYNQSASYCDVYNRYDKEPGERSTTIGLRLVRNAE